MTDDPSKAAASPTSETSSVTTTSAAAPTKKKAPKEKAAKNAIAKSDAKSGSKSGAKSGATKKAASKKAVPQPASKQAASPGASAATSSPTPAGPSARPARGAFAAGAARASGERRRRSGTPLIPSAPVELSAARRLAAGAGADALADEVVSAVTEGPTEPETRGPATGASPARAARAGRGSPPTEPGDGAGTFEPVVGEAAGAETVEGETVEVLEVADAPETVDPADVLPAEPTPPRRPRPPRSAVRSTRRATPGEPARLRAVPPVEPIPTQAEGQAGDHGTRHTQTAQEGGWERALTSGLQSRAEKLVGAVLEGAEFSSESRPGPTELVELAVNVLRAAASSAGVPAEDVERQVAETLAYLRRRLTGDYVVDEFGFDEDYTVNVHLPLLRPFYKTWFRVEVRGIENIPDEGGALVVGNHSGTIAMDSLMTQVAVYDEHPRHRHLRMLGADLVFQMPFVGAMARRSGTTLAANSDAERLLSSGALVGVWPEGFKGVGKPFSERYKLQRFGRGGFVSAALRAGVPIVPVSIVGAEEIYPILGNMPAVARLLGLPYAPITPTFPLLGPLGMVPLPSKWLIEFGPPIETTSFGPEAADDPMLVFDLTDQVRETIQQTLYSLLMQRKSVFL
ncbi:hypothetical protein GCM10009868_10140 [Terrabacter aerolatus]|uniref:1-acyl-sn-glycerol-3-phosphate acyltransferase n=1 Tax=Terrabacter aerolatus TaxID=422442 RepID=UPI0031DB63F0